jgi:hypothetical protein
MKKGGPWAALSFFSMAGEPPAAESSTASITGYAGEEFGSGQFLYFLKSCITGGARDE